MLDLATMVAIGVPTGGGLVAWGVLKQKVERQAEDIGKLDREKASNDVVNAHFTNIVERLDRMEKKLDRNTSNGH